MIDAGVKATEKQYLSLRKKLERLYSQAFKDLQKKLYRHIKRFAAKDKQMHADLLAGKISKEKYQSWLMGQVFTGKRWKDRIGTVARTLTNLNRQAMNLLRNGVISVFAQNMNYQNYKLEHDLGVDTGFSVYNPESVSRLIKDEPSVLPKWRIDEEKDYVWNAQKVRDIVTQGIIQGESVQQIADRLARDLKSTNMRKMQMFARTAVTGAQNAGRIEAMRKQQELGIHVHKKWIATHDSRTRDTHLDLDGQTAEIDDPFEVAVKGAMEEIQYPGDPNAVPELVYNCRCTLGYVYPDLIKMTQKLKPNEQAKGMTYDQWIEAKENRERQQGVVK